ncbi:MAG: PilZ domain-containing protein [Fibrobacter sp.]|nr:PilZ domain-containing protein [Fibrobacter sp.]
MLLQQNSFLKKSFGLIFLLIFSAFGSSSLIQQIGWRKAEPAIIIGIVIIILLIVLILILIQVRRDKKRQKDETRFSKNMFREYVENTELNTEEKACLNRLLVYANTPNLHVIFQSASLFEQCLGTYVQELLDTHSESIDDEEKILSSLRKKMGFSYLPLEHPLISSRNIEVGQKGTVFPETEKVILIRSAVITLNKEYFFRIQYNSDKESAVQFYQGQKVRLVFARQSDGMYGITVEVFRVKGATVDFYHTMELKRNQLRQYARVDVNLPLKFWIVKTEKENEKEKLTGGQCDGKIVDISGGGLSFIYSKPLTPGDIVSFKFQLTTAHFSGVTAKVLRVSILEGGTADMYKHHVQFYSIEPKLREKIVKYIFEKQRQMSQWR